MALLIAAILLLVLLVVYTEPRKYGILETDIAEPILDAERFLVELEVGPGASYRWVEPNAIWVASADGGVGDPFDPDKFF